MNRFHNLILICCFQAVLCSIVHGQNVSVNSIIDALHDPISDYVMVVAHRGAHQDVPENTLASIERAIALGVDIVELDVRTTKDGKLILMHDRTIDRTVHGSGEVSDFTWEQLYNMTLKSKDGKAYRIPTLKDALTLSKDRILVDLDIKDASVLHLTQIVEEIGNSEQVIFFDSDTTVLDSILLLNPSYTVMPRARSFSDVVRFTDKYEPLIIHIDPSFFEKDIVQTLKARKVRIWINALGTADTIAKTGDLVSAYRSLVEKGANVIQTDLPDTLLNYLRALGKHP